jgi:hypothetical protein
MHKWGVIITLAVLCGLGSSQARADVIDWVTAKMVKDQLSDACGEDSDCAQAVDKQFDACLEKSDFLKYMNSPKSEEDKYLDSTFDFLYSCIVDKDGYPYFQAPEEDA